MSFVNGTTYLSETVDIAFANYLADGFWIRPNAHWCDGTVTTVLEGSNAEWCGSNPGI